MENEKIFSDILAGDALEGDVPQVPETIEVPVYDCPRPVGFPEETIILRKESFCNWALDVQAPSIWVAYPQMGESDLPDIANWAAANGYTVRPRGRSHNWSPLAVMNGGDVRKVIFVDTSCLNQKVFNPDNAKPSVTVGTGVLVEEMISFLQQQTDAPDGYSFINMTGPGALTIGGILTIGAHGTSIDAPGVDTMGLGGCLSNLVERFTAVVYFSGKYRLREFYRDNTEAGAFLVHLGRAFITEVTLRVVPNYYLQVENVFPQKEELFQRADEPPKNNSLQSLAAGYGRLEVIWFPYTDTPWVKVWKQVSKQNAVGEKINAPYAYKFANGVRRNFSNFIKKLYRDFPRQTGSYLNSALNIVKISERGKPGHKMHGLSGNLLLYVKDSTLRVTSWGYAVHIKRSEIQESANLFYEKFTALLTEYNMQDKYPVNSAVEIRYTTVDRTDTLDITGAEPPWLSATTPVSTDYDTVFWVDVLSFPGTVHMCEFFKEMEEWVYTTWRERARPEWSKGWAYTNDSAYSNPEVLQNRLRNELYPKFVAACDVFNKYDPQKVFISEFLEKFLK